VFPDLLWGISHAFGLKLLDAGFQAFGCLLVKQQAGFAELKNIKIVPLKAIKYSYNLVVLPRYLRSAAH